MRVGREATVVLVTADGEVLGALPPIELALPWWQESADLVTAVRERHGIDVVVLRLLGAQLPHPPGGQVRYLAQTDGRPDGLAPAEVDLSPQPHRLPYAEIAGPHRTLDWAASHLGHLTAAQQMRTWNLSTIWRLEAGRETVWLKQVPPFFAHEPAVIGWASAHAAVPRLIAADSGRMLLRDIPGDDLYGAGPEVRAAIARDHHQLQLASLTALDSLAAVGVPDRRGERLGDWLEVLHNPLVRPARQHIAQALACGLPEALVHGDLHPGNVRGDADHRTVLDWGDCSLGHPAFDILRLTDGLDESEAQPLLDAWAERWRIACPGSDPLRAVDLLRPVAALCAAAAYATFVANIEPAEHPYHADDVPFWISRAADLFG
jgi:hypothetical protein